MRNLHFSWVKKRKVVKQREIATRITDSGDGAREAALRKELVLARSQIERLKKKGNRRSRTWLLLG